MLPSTLQLQLRNLPSSHASNIPVQYTTYSLRSSDEQTTETEDAAMATEAIHGMSSKPKGMKKPVAHSHQARADEYRARTLGVNMDTGAQQRHCGTWNYTITS